MRVQLDRANEYPIAASYLEELDKGSGLEFLEKREESAGSSGSVEGGVAGEGAPSGQPQTTEEMRDTLQRRAQQRRVRAAQNARRRKSTQASPSKEIPSGAFTQRQLLSSLLISLLELAVYAALQFVCFVRCMVVTRTPLVFPVVFPSLQNRWET